MRNAIFLKFIKVLLVALIINIGIFYLVASSILLKNTRKDMLYTIKMLDQTIDYTKELESQIKPLELAASDTGSRLTIIDKNGVVQVDTGVVEMDTLDNHLEREEIADALYEGSGYSRRYSDTLHTTLLYVAIPAHDPNYIIRLSVPFLGIRGYIVTLLPAIWLSIAVSMIVSAIVADNFSKSITRPLNDISQEMLKVNATYTNLTFDQYQYPEFNVIAQTTSKMSNHVKEYLKQIDLERQIRQEFFSNASHELKTPLTSIQGYTELLESGMIEDAAIQKDFLQRIKKESGNMTNLINDILMISRLESKEAEVIKSEVRIRLVLEDVIESLKPMAVQCSVFVETDCKPLAIMANPQQMKELLGNLISNAIKYNKPGGRVWVTITTEDKFMVIKVKDTGTGIPSDSLNRIFDRFYRLDKGRNKKLGGTGLGLSIVKHIIQYYNGTIRVVSKVEEGTEFIVHLPVE